MAAAAAKCSSSEDLYLGFDSSTQSFKVTVVRASDLQVVYSDTVNFAHSLPEYEPILHIDGARVSQDPLMWVAALDMLLDRMKSAKFPFGAVVAVSGSGQQHGSVYLRKGADAVLASLDPARSVVEQLVAVKKSFFAVPFSPIWMDSSTRAQCEHLEAAMPGGPLQVAHISGSVATERFTGNQIRKILEDHPVMYQSTERIALVSSFMCSILSGVFAPIDASDGAGMNLLDVNLLDWSPLLLEATAPDLRSKLGPVVASTHILGSGLSRYFCKRYGFSSDCKSVVWSGDNPCSLVGLGVTRPGNTAISLGTSDTLFGITPTFAPRATGNILTNPINNVQKMILLCFKNGSLVRQRVQEAYAGGSWEKFEELLNSTEPGIGGVCGVHIDFPEITPRISETGEFFFKALEPSKEGSIKLEEISAAELSPAQKARSVLESQFMSMRLHATKSGVQEIGRLVVTGGASENKAVLQVLSDVFATNVESISQKDSASIGAAFRAHWSTALEKNENAGFDELLGEHIRYEVVAEPNPEASKVYAALLPQLEACQEKLLQRRH